jgi:hypothetical protein
MLVPLTREAFEDLIPTVATGAQYGYYWGDFQTFLKRLLVSVVSLIVVVFLPVGLFSEPLKLLLGLVAALYWLWGPVAWASARNAKARRYPYCGFWHGKILDIFVTEETIGTEETTNERGDLVIVENRERRFNLEVGDKTGFKTTIQVPLRRHHKAIRKGQSAQMLVLSNQPDLSRIGQVSDVYIADRNLWVSDYPYLQRDRFIEISRELKSKRRNPRQARSAR